MTEAAAAYLNQLVFLKGAADIEITLPVEFIALKILHNDLVKKTKKADEYPHSEIYKQLVSDTKYINLKQEISQLELAVKNGERKKTQLKFSKDSIFFWLL